MEKTMHKYEFPDYFPDGCPPAEATDDEIDLFRLCCNNPPCEDDFIPYYLSDPQKYKDIIKAYGLSTFASIPDSLAATRKNPFLRDKYDFIAQGMTDATKGKHLPTPGPVSDNHITWWIYKEVHPHTFFTVCAEVG